MYFSSKLKPNVVTSLISWHHFNDFVTSLQRFRVFGREYATLISPNIGEENGDDVNNQQFYVEYNNNIEKRISDKR